MTKLKIINNWIEGDESNVANGEKYEKINPHTGEISSYYVGSSDIEVKVAIDVAQSNYEKWSKTTPVARGNAIANWVNLLRENKQQLADIIAIETGKPPNDALGEVNAAIIQGDFFAGEGMRMYARSLTSGMVNKYSHTVRQSIGVAGLIVPANTPIANIAWKIFPALICGNTVVLKASEDAPYIALKLAQLSKESGLPDGVFNVIQGKGDPAGKALVEDTRVAIISFTGSTNVGKWIAEVAGRRLARVSLELGGKNPFVVCDDSDLDEAVHWASLSAFSNAGQRCASGSRIIVFEEVYDIFIKKLIEKANSLKLGVDRDCDLGPVINKNQYTNIIAAIERAKHDGGNILCGGKIVTTKHLNNGFYVQPTLISELPENAELCSLEVFGPVAIVQKVKNLTHALDVSNNTEYGLTAAIHTRNVDKAMWFAQNVRAGTVNINIGTFGSEPHMPFGGYGASGNGTREPGVEALDVYSEIKNISFLVRDAGFNK